MSVPGRFPSQIHPWSDREWFSGYLKVEGQAGNLSHSPSEALGLSLIGSFHPVPVLPLVSCHCSGTHCSCRIVTDPWNEQRAGISPLFITHHSRRKEQQAEHPLSLPTEMREQGGWKRLGNRGIQTSPSPDASCSPSFPVQPRIPLNLFAGACPDISKGAFLLDYDVIS